jgi:hypothetical protein
MRRHEHRPTNHPDVATLLNTLIRLNHAMEAYEQALPPAEQALGIYQRLHPWQSRIELPEDDFPF